MYKGKKEIKLSKLKKLNFLLQKIMSRLLGKLASNYPSRLTLLNQKPIILEPITIHSPNLIFRRELKVKAGAGAGAGKGKKGAAMVKPKLEVETDAHKE